jgi:hypothetical protein
MANEMASEIGPDQSECRLNKQLFVDLVYGTVSVLFQIENLKLLYNFEARLSVWGILY